MVKQVELNEGFKALVNGILDNEEANKRLVNAFVEVVNDRATMTRLNIDDLKSRAVEDIKSEFVTKDFVRAEIADTKEELRSEIRAVRDELKAEISALRDELKADISSVRGEISAVRNELKADISAVRGEISALRDELKAEISALRDEMYKTKIELFKWVVGLQLTTTGLIIAAMKFL
ncbi:MAG: CCDC90 family protein [Helicobacter sp.]|nr:CCDC90 family protein [Helicobacter sp.]